MPLTVEEVMQSGIVTASKGSSVTGAVKKMEKYLVGSVIVTKSSGEALGIVTSTDVLYKVIARDKDPKKVKVDSIMSSPLIVIEPSATLEAAAEKMTEHGVKKLPVTEGRNLVGIITASDIVASGDEYLNVLVNLVAPSRHIEAGS